MRRLGSALALVLGIGLSGGVVTFPREAECATCPSYTCYGSCGAGCVCMTKGMEIGGTCVSFDHAATLESGGWSLAR